MTTAKPIVDNVLPKHQVDLIEQFEADYNTIDAFLRKALGTDKQTPFTHLVREYFRQHAGWRDAELLATVAEIRNAIVHGKTEPYRYVAIPTPAIAAQLGACRKGLISPALAFPTFRRTVETVRVEDSLASVLKTIKQRDYSQFPVYEGEHFRGLLTENGITRWLAHHVATDLSLVDLDDIHVGQVLDNEEERRNWRFVSRGTRVDDVSALFSRQLLLEAVLVTASGKQSEKPLGVATRWDILHLA